MNAACVANVRSTGKVMELREDEARWFCIKREAELAKCGFSKDFEGCRVAASGDEVSRPHGKECRERIRSGYDVRRRRPAEIARGAGATRVRSIGRKS